MASSSLRSNQIVDVPLTKLAQGYRAPELVADKVFPKVVTPAAAGTYIKWDKEAFRLYQTRRAQGAKATRVDFSFSKNAFAFGDGMSLDSPIDARAQKLIALSTNINLAAQRAKPLMRNIAIQKEIDVATIVKNPASHANSLAIVTNWNAASPTIKKDVDAARKKMLDSIGIEGNILVVSNDVFNVLKLDPSVQNMYKYTTPGFPTAKILAEAFEVDEIVVGKGSYINAAGTSTPIWGTGLACLIYRGVGSDTYPLDPSDMDPSFGYLLQEEGMPRTVRYWDDSARSEVVGVDDNFLALQTSTEASCFFTNVIV